MYAHVYTIVYNCIILYNYIYIYTFQFTLVYTTAYTPLHIQYDILVAYVFEIAHAVVPASVCNIAYEVV